MSKMVETITQALEELKVSGVCRFHAGYISGKEWNVSYAPKLREAFPDCWWTVNSANHLVVHAK